MTNDNLCGTSCVTAIINKVIFFTTGAFKQFDSEESGEVELNLTEVISVLRVSLIAFFPIFAVCLT